MKNPLSLILIGTALLGLSSAANAISHFVPPEQLNRIHAGETSSEVIAQLGQPESKPRWMNGTYSLAYETAAGENSDRGHVYVDVDASTQKVLGYTVIDDQ